MPDAVKGPLHVQEHSYRMFLVSESGGKVVNYPGKLQGRGVFRTEAVPGGEVRKKAKE